MRNSHLTQQILTLLVTQLIITTNNLKVQAAEAAVVDADEAAAEADGELQRRQQLLPVDRQDHFQGAPRQAHCLTASGRLRVF